MKRIFLVLTFFVLTFNLFSQNEQFGASYLLTEGRGFNFFTGANADNFTTTPKAFGSGIYDFSGQYSIMSFWLLKPHKHNIGLATTIGLKINKFRFLDNLYFDTNNDVVLEDTTSTRFYNQMFFSRHGSKLVVGKLNIPLVVYLPVSQWFGDEGGFFGIYAGGYYDGYLFSYHKLIFKENGQVVKQKTPNSSLKDYFTKNSFGVRGGLKIGPVFVFGQHSLTPFFNNKLPYEIYETKVGFTFKFDFSNKFDDFDFDDFDFDNNGTDAK